MSMTEQRSTSDNDAYENDERRYNTAIAALIAGGVLGVFGVLGFIPGVTQHVPFKSGERFSGPESHAMIFGVFQTSVFANLIFLGFALLGGVSAFFEISSRAYLFGTAFVFAVFGIYGLAIDRSSAANFLPLDVAGSVLRLAIAIVLLVAGVVFTLRRRH